MPSEIEKIITEASSYLQHCDAHKIYQAYEFARKAHDGQKRFSGEDYIIHPVAACQILMKLKPDTDTICACLLHDVPEDTAYTLEDINSRFGPSVTHLVDGLVKLSKVHPLDEDIQVDNLRKMFLAMAKDLRVVLIKFSDRIHNLRTLQYVNINKQRRIARESLDIYAAVAGRLGIYSVKTEIEDICFRYLLPKEYENIKSQMEGSAKNRQQFIKYVRTQLLEIFKNEGLNIQVSSRIKHYYSIYNKLKRKNKNFIHELYDIVALRIIMDDKSQSDKNTDFSHCYKTLGIIHKHWTPLPHRFKDYIALPKANGYQSLHTTVMGLGGKDFQHPTEIQIRTKTMHFESEFGIAAHWEYKEGTADLAVSQARKDWVQNLVSLHNDWQNNKEFLDNLKIDIFKDRLFILTPRGDVKDLPQGATPIDFAYSIHTEVGHRFKGAMVNGAIVSLDHKLKNGDVVEILTGKGGTPNLYWLSSIVTNSAKAKIKNWFKNQNRENLIKSGRELVNKQLLRHNAPPLSNKLQELDAFFGKKSSLKKREEVLEQVGHGSLPASVVVRKIIEKEDFVKNIKVGSKTTPNPAPHNEKAPKDKTEILIKGESGYETRLAACCLPQVGDEIIGYITKGQGLAIHRKNCNFIQKKADPERLFEAQWSCKIKHKPTVKVVIEGKNKIPLLRGILNILEENKVDIKNLTTFNGSKNSCQVNMTLKVQDFDQLNKVFDKIEDLSLVSSVKKT